MAERRYSRTHEWCEVDGDVATCGITKHAADELGDLTFLDFRVAVGASVKQGDVFGEIDSVKATSELFSPLSGTVEAINERFRDADQLGALSGAPETDGWMIKLRLSAPAEAGKLLTRADYEKFCAEGAGH
ncbi:MAG: glycine cleavage system protein H [Planctomycetota bacterium]|nr:glycine cleavage system protein H [Planctomycetota bacterium]